MIEPKSVVRHDANRLLHKNTMLYDAIFLMTVIRKSAIQFIDYLFLTTCALCFSSTNDRFGLKSRPNVRLGISAKCLFLVHYISMRGYFSNIYGKSNGNILDI